MRTVSIFKDGNNRAIRLYRDLDCEGVSELEIAPELDAAGCRITSISNMAPYSDPHAENNSSSCNRSSLHGERPA